MKLMFQKTAPKNQLIDNIIEISDDEDDNNIAKKVTTYADSSLSTYNSGMLLCMMKNTFITGASIWGGMGVSPPNFFEMLKVGKFWLFYRTNTLKIAYRILTLEIEEPWK